MSNAELLFSSLRKEVKEIALPNKIPPRNSSDAVFQMLEPLIREIANLRSEVDNLKEILNVFAERSG